MIIIVIVVIIISDSESPMFRYVFELRRRASRCWAPYAIDRPMASRTTYTRGLHVGHSPIFSLLRLSIKLC